MFLSKKKKHKTIRIDSNAPDNRSFIQKMISHYAKNPALFFGILFAAVMITLAITQQQ